MYCNTLRALKASCKTIDIGKESLSPGPDRCVPWIGIHGRKGWQLRTDSVVPLQSALASDLIGLNIGRHGRRGFLVLQILGKDPDSYTHQPGRRHVKGRKERRSGLGAHYISHASHVIAHVRVKYLYKRTEDLSWILITYYTDSTTALTERR